MAIIVEGGELSALEWQALKVAGKEADQLRADVEVGTAQPVDLTLRVSGTIDVADSKLQISANKPRLEVVLAAILERLDRGGLSDAGALLGYFKRRKGPLEPTDGSLAAAKLIVDGLSETVTKTVNGAVKGAMTLTRL